MRYGLQEPGRCQETQGARCGLAERLGRLPKLAEERGRDISGCGLPGEKDASVVSFRPLV